MKPCAVPPTNVRHDRRTSNTPAIAPRRLCCVYSKRRTLSLPLQSSWASLPACTHHHHHILLLSLGEPQSPRRVYSTNAPRVDVGSFVSRGDSERRMGGWGYKDGRSGFGSGDMDRVRLGSIPPMAHTHTHSEHKRTSASCWLAFCCWVFFIFCCWSGVSGRVVFSWHQQRGLCCLLTFLFCVGVFAGTLPAHRRGG